MNEARAVAQFLYATLTQSAPVAALVGARVYESIGPPGAQYPAIVFHQQSSSVRNAAGAVGRIFCRPLYVVKAVSAGGTYAISDQIAAAIDDALVGAQSTVVISGVTYEIAVAGLESHVRYVELVDGVRYNHAGGLYRLFVCGV